MITDGELTAALQTLKERDKTQVKLVDQDVYKGGYQETLKISYLLQKLDVCNIASLYKCLTRSLLTLLTEYFTYSLYHFG